MSEEAKLEKKSIKKLTKKLGREPTTEEVAKYIAKKNGKSSEKVEKKSKKSKKEKKEKKTKKRSKAESSSDESVEEKAGLAKVAKVEVTTETETASTPAPAQESNGDVDYTLTKVANPQNSPRVFLGNCSYSIDEAAVREYFKKCGGIEEVFWLNDKETGKFYGSGFITFVDADSASRACSFNSIEFMGRPMKVEITTPRQAKTTKPKGPAKQCTPTSEKKQDCNTLFLGNLSFQIDDSNIYDFFKGIGQVTSIRWCENKETGDFKGCGFVEFADPSSIDKAVELAGTDLLGRQVRMDYA